MEEEVVNILKAVNEGLKSLPPVASDAWKLMSEGKMLDGISKLIVFFIFVSLFLLSINVLKNNLEKTNEFRLKITSDFDYQDRENMKDTVDNMEVINLIFLCLTIVLGSILIINTLSINDWIVDILMPEYSNIKDAISLIK